MSYSSSTLLSLHLLSTTQVAGTTVLTYPSFAWLVFGLWISEEACTTLIGHLVKGPEMGAR